ncbi:hypothetical protein LY76DRAFT_319389 [Colletotrichum caudatum]|nr:hypothetical protein LY76DRAFT_319389 [Colletotrichum caudatum]
MRCSRQHSPYPRCVAVHSRTLENGDLAAECNAVTCCSSPTHHLVCNTSWGGPNVRRAEEPLRFLRGMEAANRTRKAPRIRLGLPEASVVRSVLGRPCGCVHYPGSIDARLSSTASSNDWLNTAADDGINQPLCICRLFFATQSESRATLGVENSTWGWFV